jgi:hypothetical protein
MKEFKKVYICSPLLAPTRKGIEENMAKALEYMEIVSATLNCKAVAPHAFLPLFLDDRDPVERKLGLEFGLRYLATCDALIVCGDRITEGMSDEIVKAIDLGIPALILRTDARQICTIGGCEVARLLRRWLG